MSAEQLRLDDSYGKSLNFSKFAGQIAVLPIVEKIGDQIRLDNNQAHLLYLYLKEHLRLETTARDALNKLMKGYWYCSRCDLKHPENYVCERIGK